jgi:hypothetical protein
LKHFALTPQTALIRLDGQYGDAVVMTQLMQAGVYWITRGRTYGMLDRPQLQRVLTHPSSARVTARNTGKVIELFDGRWLHLDLDEGSPKVRVIGARHAAPPSGKKVTVGKRLGEWVYELFMTTLPVDGFLVEDAWDLYQSRGASAPVLSDEDVEIDPDRWCSHTECGQELWQIACQWVWNLRLSLGKSMQGDELREVEWAPSKEAILPLPDPEPAPEEYGPWQLAGGVGRAQDQIGSSSFVWQEDGKLRCPGFCYPLAERASVRRTLSLNGLFTWPTREIVSVALYANSVWLQEPACNRARRVSAMRRLLPPLTSIGRKPITLGPMRWVDVAGRALRRRWAAHWRQQYVEVIPLVQLKAEKKPPPRPPRSVRSHHRWSWQDRLVCNAGSSPPLFRVTVAGVPAFLAMS